jgi:hypothetical protein
LAVTQVEVAAGPAALGIAQVDVVTDDRNPVDGGGWREAPGSRAG